LVTYLARRLLQALPVVLLASIVVFVFLRALPGDPASLMAGQDATPEQVAAITKRFELDKPIYVQYLTWVQRMAAGDMGTAYGSQRPVKDLILGRLPATLHLATGTILLMLTLGLPLGIFSAVRPHHPLSRFLLLGNALALAMPTFWLGILLVLLFGVTLKWLPPSGFASITDDPVQSIRLLILPCVTLGVSGTSVLIRFVNASISEVMGSDFVRTAHAKGLAERAVVMRHVLKVSMLPVITIMAIQFGYLLGGAVVTEAVFGLPGVGRLLIDAINTHNYIVIQDMMMLFVITFIALNILADACYALLDPRIRLG